MGIGKVDGGCQDSVIGSAKIGEEGGCGGKSVAAGGEGPRFSVEGDGGVDANVKFAAGIE